MKKTKEQKIRNDNGITLIALIITIIVMLILVAVTITTAVDGGLFGKATMVGKLTNESIAKEQELARGRLNIANVWYDSIWDYIKNKPSENQGTNSNGKYLVDCEECGGKKYIDGGPIYGDDEGTLFCQTHGIQNEFIGSFSVAYCTHCKIYTKKNNNICSKCGNDLEDYEPAEDLALCLLCIEEGKYHEFDGFVCEDCNGTGLREVNCIKCLDEKEYKKEYCVECKSTNIKTEYEYDYVYWCEDCEAEYDRDDEGPIACPGCGKSLNYFSKDLIDEYKICGDCGGDYEVDWIACDCVKCKTCLDKKITQRKWGCTKCKNTDLTYEVESTYYECEDCWYELSSDENIEDGCPECGGTMSLQERGHSICSKCKSDEDISEYFPILCPDCGECWTCYDGEKPQEILCCTECGGRDFEEVEIYQYECWECGYSTTKTKDETTICPDCKYECDTWEEYETKCTKCGSTSREWKEIECPDCKK